MIQDKGVLRINLLESFQQLIIDLSAFCTAIGEDNSRSAWVSRREPELQEGLDMRVKAIRLYQALWYEEGQDGRETLTCPGIVGASAGTMEMAHICNASKDRFKQAVLSLKQLSRTDITGLMTDLHKRNEEVAAAMRRMGVARLNLKQAYRHVPLLDEKPLKIGFTWSKQGRVIQRTTVGEARRLLERRRDSPQVLLELQRLAELTETETLARVRRICPHLRANVVFQDESGNISRRLMQAPLPILIPLAGGESLPEFVPIAPEPIDSPRLQRSDVRIEETPFLPSIRIHRYRASYR